MEVGQGTAQELVAEEERNRRNIDSFVQEPHRECMPETVEGDMLADTCSRDELGDFMVEDVRRQGGEDGPSILDCSQIENKWVLISCKQSCSYLLCLIG